MVINISVQYNGGFVLIAFVVYITTTMCDGVLHCLWFASYVFRMAINVNVHSITVGFSPTLYRGPNVICIGEPV